VRAGRSLLSPSRDGSLPNISFRECWGDPSTHPHGRRRKLRPLAKKEAIHLVIRSSWAKGAASFLKSHNKNAIEKILCSTAKTYGVRIYRKAIAGNHAHLVLRITNRPLYASFIRVATSKIASHVMKGKSFTEFKSLVLNPMNANTHDTKNANTHETQFELQGLGQKFFQFRPFTRILHWGRDFKTCCAYVLQNTLEALGFVEYQPRQERYARWLLETLPGS